MRKVSRVLLIMLFSFSLISCNSEKGKQSNGDLSISIDQILNEENQKKWSYYYYNVYNHGSGSVTKLEVVAEDDQMISKQEAKEMAVEHLLEEAGKIYEANKSGLTVSKSEVDEVVNQYLETSREMQPKELLDLLEDLDLTMEEYFMDYAYDSYAQALLTKKLYEHYVSSYDGHDLNGLSLTEAYRLEVDKWAEKMKEKYYEEVLHLLSLEI